MDPAITFFNDFDRCCHFEIDKVIKVDPAITCFNDFDRVCHFELQKKYRGGEGS